jgi:hypothetical protein
MSFQSLLLRLSLAEAAGEWTRLDASRLSSNTAAALAWLWLPPLGLRRTRLTRGVRGDDPLTPGWSSPRGQHCLNGCAVPASAGWEPRRSSRLAGPVVAEQGAAAADRGLGLLGEAADDGGGRLDRPDQSDRLAGVHVIGVEIVRGAGPAEPFVLRG